MRIEQFYSHFGIADYESRGFTNALCHYINARDCDELSHAAACESLRIGGQRWEDACLGLYRLVLDVPELWW